MLSDRCLSCLSVMLVYMAKRWMDLDETRHGLGIGPGHIVWIQLPPPKKKGYSFPNFRPMSIVAKQSPTSATAEYL